MAKAKDNVDTLNVPTIATTIPHLREFDSSVNVSVEATALVIKDQLSFEQANAMLNTAKDLLDTLTDEKKKFTEPYNDALKAVRGWFKPGEERLEKVISMLQRKMSAYVVEEQERRKKAQREADAAAEAERRRLAERARRAEEAGKEEKAQELQQKAAEVVTEVVPQRVQAETTKTTMVWKGRVKDKIAFIKAVADGVIPDSLVEIDEGKLNGIARQSEGGMKFPGVEWYQEAQFRRK